MTSTIIAAPTEITTLTARNADLPGLIELLEDQYTRQRDMIVTARQISVEGTQLLVEGQGRVDLSMDGVTTLPGVYTPTEICDRGLSDKFDIPFKYLRRIRAEMPGLYDATLNTHLAGDSRNFMIRTLANADGNGLARAFLSDKYKIIDNLDVLYAALDGLREAGVPVEIDACDLTERRMYIRVRCDGVKVLAPALLANYRSPFNGRTGAECPVVRAGFVIANSELGTGALTITPEITVEICGNGLQITRDIVRKIHSGVQQGEGVIDWSPETQKRELALLTSMTTDAVKAFLSPEYATRVIREIEIEAGRPVTDAAATVEIVGKQLRFSEERRATILNHFIKGGDTTAGGILHAVTSVARTLPNADDAYAMQAKGLDAMHIAASI
jgi:hypothetical protein